MQALQHEAVVVYTSGSTAARFRSDDPMKLSPYCASHEQLLSLLTSGSVVHALLQRGSSCGHYITYMLWDGVPVLLDSLQVSAVCR